MGGLTVSLFVICHGFRGRPGRINRYEGGLLLTAYCAYTAWLIDGVMA
jgi:cation:H+ antiporter